MSAQDTARAQDQARVSVRILEKEYSFACPYDERSALLDAAEYLNARMREIRDSGKVVGLDRIAVMVALNLANEITKMKEQEARAETESVSRVRVLREKVEKNLEKSGQLDLEG